jgi:hypothetical protein
LIKLAILDSQLETTLEPFFPLLDLYWMPKPSSVAHDTSEVPLLLKMAKYSALLLRIHQLRVSYSCINYAISWLRAPVIVSDANAVLKTL